MLPFALRIFVCILLAGAVRAVHIIFKPLQRARRGEHARLRDVATAGGAGGGARHEWADSVVAVHPHELHQLGRRGVRHGVQAPLAQLTVVVLRFPGDELAQKRAEVQRHVGTRRTGDVMEVGQRHELVGQRVVLALEQLLRVVGGLCWV